MSMIVPYVRHEVVKQDEIENASPGLITRAVARATEDYTNSRGRREGEAKIGMYLGFVPKSPGQGERCFEELVYSAYDNLGGRVVRHNSMNQDGENSSYNGLEVFYPGKGKFSFDNGAGSTDEELVLARKSGYVVSAGLGKVVLFDGPEFDAVGYLREQFRQKSESDPIASEHVCGRLGDKYGSSVSKRQLDEFEKDVYKAIGDVLYSVRERILALNTKSGGLYDRADRLQSMLQPGENWMDSWQGFNGEVSDPDELRKTAEGLDSRAEELRGLVGKLGGLKSEVPTILEDLREKYVDDILEMPVKKVLRQVDLAFEKFPDLITAAKNVTNDVGIVFALYANPAFLSNYGQFDTVNLVERYVGENIGMVADVLGLDRKFYFSKLFSPDDITDRKSSESLWGPNNHSFTTIAVGKPIEQDSSLLRLTLARTLGVGAPKKLGMESVGDLHE